MSLTKNIMNDVVVSCSLPKLIDSSFTMGIMKTRSKLDRFHYVSIFGSKQKLHLYLVRMLDLFLPCQDFLILSFSFLFFVISLSRKILGCGQVNCTRFLFRILVKY